MTKFLIMLRSKRGASAAEYALILAIIGAAIAVAALFLGDAIGEAINSAGSCIETPTTAVCS